MRSRYLLLCAVLLCVALSEPPVKFLHPKSRMVMVGIGGTDIPLQAWIERHPDNRSYLLEWGGDACPGGSSGKTLDGEHEARVQPEFKPILVSLTQPGVCHLQARVFAAGGKLRASAQMDVRVCGGGEDC